MGEEEEEEQEQQQMSTGGGGEQQEACSMRQLLTCAMRSNTSCVHDGRAAAGAIMSGETPAGYQSDDSIGVRILLQPRQSAEMQERSGLNTKEGVWG